MSDVRESDMLCLHDDVNWLFKCSLGEGGREERRLDILFVLLSEGCFASGLDSEIEDRRNIVFFNTSIRPGSLIGPLRRAI